MAMKYSISGLGQMSPNQGDRIVYCLYRVVGQTFYMV